MKGAKILKTIVDLAIERFQDNFISCGTDKEKA